MGTALNFLIFIGTLYLLVMVGMFLFQRHLIYHPVKKLGPPQENGFSAGTQVEILTQDGERLRCWYVKPTSKLQTILYLHGNAGNLADRAYKLKAFAEAGFGVLAVSWRGFGDSTGSPSEVGLMQDARAAIHWLKVPSDQLVLYGESLGSGVAVQMATEFPARLTMLEAPYISVQKRGQELYPWLPVKFLLRDNFNSMKHIAHIHSPLLIIHGEKDAVIPATHGIALFNEANEPKKIILYPSVDHTSFSITQIIEPLEAALAEWENGKPE